MTTANADSIVSASERTGSAKRILIADDDADAREGLAELLRGEGYEVDLADNGRAALELLTDRKRRPALVLLDLAMPELNGWQVLDALAVHPGSAHTAVMVLSGLENVASPRPRVRWVRKPIEPRDLLVAIRATLAST